MPNRSIRDERDLVSFNKPKQPMMKQTTARPIQRTDGRPVVGPADDATRRRLLAEKLGEKGDGNLYRAPPQPAKVMNTRAIQRSTQPGDGDLVQNRANTDMANGVSALINPRGMNARRMRNSGAE